MDTKRKQEIFNITLLEEIETILTKFQAVIPAGDDRQHIIEVGLEALDKVDKRPLNEFQKMVCESDVRSIHEALVNAREEASLLGIPASRISDAIKNFRTVCNAQHLGRAFHSVQSGASRG
jgi:hypothetical protein